MSGLLGSLRAEGALDGIEAPLSRARRLRGHASSRQFYRVAIDGGSRILVVYPRGQDAEIDRYEATAAWFREAGVRVPRIHARGVRALLVQDGGDTRLDHLASSGPLQGRCYRQAAQVVSRLEAHGRLRPPPNGGWALDAERLRAELDFFERHTLCGWLGQTRGGSRRARWFDELAGACAGLPRVVCHRDFHARNLLVADDRLMVLDFQDVMPGPIFYDLVSLLWDNYCDVPGALQAEILHGYWADASRPWTRDLGPAGASGPRGLPGSARAAFTLVALQRSLKALGTFGYQITVRGDAQYEGLIAGTWRHARRALGWLGWEGLERELEPLNRATA